MTSTTETAARAASTLEDERDIAALMTGWIYRDTGDWARLAGLFHADARISLSWFTGPAAQFVEASERMAHSAFRTKHVIAAPAIAFSASKRRATAETNAIVIGENRQLRLGAVAHTRFLDRVEHRHGRWGIVERAAVYDFSSFAFPAGPAVTVDEDAAGKYPTEYAALAYLLEASGFHVGETFVVKDSDRERDIKRSAAGWLGD
jgi:SnoaL-like domain